jgi:hypothetical protein
MSQEDDDVHNAKNINEICNTYYSDPPRFFEEQLSYWRGQEILNQRQNERTTSDSSSSSSCSDSSGLGLFAGAAVVSSYDHSTNVTTPTGTGYSGSYGSASFSANPSSSSSESSLGGGLGALLLFGILGCAMFSHSNQNAKKSPLTLSSARTKRI